MQTSQVKPPTWFMVVSGLLLLWNLMGVLAFYQHVTMSAEQLQLLTAEEQNLYANQPAWVIVAFAFAVFGGTLGCALMLAKKAFAKVVLLLSLIGVVVQMSYSFLIAETLEVYGPGAMIMPLMVLLIAGGLIWLAHFAKQKGWLV